MKKRLINRILTALLLLSMAAGFVPVTMAAPNTITLYDGSTCSVEGVVQGTDGTHFTAAMNTANLFVDALLSTYTNFTTHVIATTDFEAVPAEDGKFALNTSDRPGVMYTGGIPADTKVEKTGELFYFEYPNVITKEDGVTKANLRVTYSNFRAVTNAGVSFDENVYIASGTVLWGHLDSNGAVGFTIDMNVQVVDNAGNPVDGIFTFPITDIDVLRRHIPDGYTPVSTTYPESYGVSVNSTANLYGGEAENYYSESIRVNGGQIGDLYVPGGTADDPNDSNKGYKCYITNDGTGIRFQPTASDSATSSAYGTEGSPYTGFVAAVDNSTGISLTYWSACSRDYSFKTFLMAGTTKDGGPLSYRVKSTTSAGGTIGTDIYDNSIGTTVYTDTNGETYVVAYGGSITFKMTPDTGSRLKQVYVSNVSTLYQEGRTLVTPTAVDEDSDGTTDYYTYTFTGLTKDASIHVDWEHDDVKLRLKKETEGNVPGNFTLSAIVSRTEESYPSDEPQGSSYTVHPGDLASYRIDFSNCTGYRFMNQNSGDYNSKIGGNPSNADWSSVVGVKGSIGNITARKDMSGTVYVRYYGVAKDSLGNTRDAVIRYTNTTIYPYSGGTNIADNDYLFVGGTSTDSRYPADAQHGYPAFQPSNKSYGSSRNEWFGVTTEATVYITTDAGTPNSGSFGTAATDGSFILNLSDIGDEYPYTPNPFASMVGASSHGNFKEAAFSGGVSADASGKLSVTGSSAGISVQLTGYGAAPPQYDHVFSKILFFTPGNEHDLTLTSGANGKVDVTTTGVWQTNGSVPNDAKVLPGGTTGTPLTYGVPDGKSVTLRLMPENGYVVDTLTVNGVAVTPVSSSGYYSYTIPSVDADTTVNVTWKIGEATWTTVTDTYYLNLTNGTTVKNPATPFVNTVSIANGGQKDYTVPYGWNYTVSEAAPSGWKLLSVNGVEGATTVSGKTTDSVNEATFLNRKIQTLTIAKQVSGNLGSRDREFDFKLTYGALVGQTVGATRITNGVSSPITLTFDTTGNVTFKLKHGESITIPDLAYNTQYTVVESGYASDGYKPKISLNGGTATAGASHTEYLTIDRTVLFDNNREVAVPTGVFDSKKPAEAGLGVSALLLALLLAFRVRKRRTDG